MALDPTADLTLDALLRRRLERAPDTPWLIDAGRVVSARQAEQLMATQAAELTASQAPGSPVVVSAGNSIGVALSLFAARRARMIWVGIHRRVQSDKRAQVVEILNRPSGIIRPEDAAVVAFTSGTSGTPKGVVHSEHNICLPAVMASERGDPGLRSGTIGMYLALTSINMQILGPIQALVSGGCCVCLDTTDSGEVAEAVQRHGISSLPMAAPTAFDWVGGAATTDQLRTLVAPVVGGSGVDDRVIDQYYERFGTRLTLGYGLTEAPTSVSRQPAGGTRTPGSSGRPLDHLRVTIRGDDGSERPPGEQGEICVEPQAAGGYAGVYRTMLGYWGDPHSTERAVRVGRLHTGDNGWLDDAGFLYVVGRGSEVIVRGGVNVNLANIERALLLAPMVTDAAVIGVSNPRLGQVPVAAVVLAKPPTRVEGVPDMRANSLPTSELATWCARNMAGAERPVRFVEVDVIPRNPMGKIDRTAVSELVAAAADDAGSDRRSPS